MMRRDMKWRDGLRCVVVITFDLDAETMWMGVAKNRPAIMSQGTYGPKVGIPRILNLLRNYNLKAGFFIPGYIIEKYSNLCLEIRDCGHEIAHHGYLHELPSLYDREKQARHIEKGLKAMKTILDLTPKGYGAPACELSEDSFSLLCQYGFLYDRSMLGDDLPYIQNLANGQIVELPISFVLDDFTYFGFNLIPPMGHGISDPDAIFNIWLREFECAYEVGGYFPLVLHPQIIGRLPRLRMLEKLINHMLSKKNVWFALPCELAEYISNQLLPEGEND